MKEGRTMEELFTVKQVAEKLKVSERTVTTYCQQGLLKSYKLKREYPISEKSFQEFLEKHLVKNEKDENLLEKKASGSV